MATSSILTQILSLINLGQSLPQAVESAAPGADPAFWQKAVARHQANPTPKKAKKSKSAGRKPGKRFANTVLFDLSYAEKQTKRRTATMAELVTRVNSSDEEARSILLTTNGETHILEVR